MNLLYAATYINFNCGKGGVIKIFWRQVETSQLQSFHTKF